MAWEPLETDEKLSTPVRKARDMDTLMLMGCGAFVVCSVTTYGLAIWPYFVWPNLERLRTLVTCSVGGLIPAWILSAIYTRRFGLPGACGVVAGALTSGIFLFLRIQQVFVAAAARQDQPPDYPESLGNLVPVANILVVALIAVVLLPKGELPSADE